MLEFGQKPAAAPAADLVRDVTEATFMADVIEAQPRGSGHRRFLGALVRALQDAWPRS